MSINAYAQLCAEFYDLTKPYASPEEIAFFCTHLAQAPRGSILEPMCGSGRLLIPLAQRGLPIEGTDYSESMLASCKKRLQEHNLSVPLYYQPIEQLSLAKQYSAIIIPVASFQLIYEWRTALQTLQRLSNHLMPGGIMLLDTFIPWDEIYANGQEVVEHASIAACDQTTITVTKRGSAERDKQQCSSTIVYEKRNEEQLLLTQTESYKLRWYYHYEMLLMLERAGFSEINAYEVDFEKNPQGIVYKAIKL